MNNVFVYCEIDKFTVEEVSYELLTKGRKLANELGVQLEAIAAGSGITGKVEKDILSYGVDKLHVFDAPGLYPYTSKPHTSILVNLFKQEQPQICLMGATVIGRDLGPRVSSSLTSGLTADCTALEIGDYDDKKTGKHYEGLLYQIRPAFGGNIVATIVNPDNRPQMATVRSGVMKAEKVAEYYNGEIVYEDVAKFVPETDYVVRVIERHVEKAANNLKGAPIIVAGGYGVGSKEGFDLLRKLADELHGEVGEPRRRRRRLLRARPANRADGRHGTPQGVHRLRHQRRYPARGGHERERHRHLNQHRPRCTDQPTGRLRDYGQRGRSCPQND